MDAASEANPLAATVTRERTGCIRLSGGGRACHLLLRWLPAGHTEPAAPPVLLGLYAFVPRVPQQSRKLLKGMQAHRS